MSFSARRALAVFRKDTLDLLKNRGLLGSMFALPATIVIVPIAVVAAYVARPDATDLKVMAHFYEPDLPAEHALRFMVEKVLLDWFSIYLVMPVFVPILISSHSVAGEKEKRTLEPLLASPITSLELILGKSLASLVPAFAICVAAFVLLCVGVDLASYRALQDWVMPNGMWLFGVFVIAPLFAFFGNGVAVLISARVGDARLAQQLSGLLVLPLVGLTAGQFAGWLKAGPAYYGVIGAVVLVLDVGILLAARRLFDRERLMSRWG